MKRKWLGKPVFVEGDGSHCDVEVPKIIYSALFGYIVSLCYEKCDGGLRGLLDVLERPADLESIKTTVRAFNPFLDPFSFFNEPVVLRIYKKTKELINKINCCLRRQTKIHDTLQCLSDIMGCVVYLVTFTGTTSYHWRFHPSTVCATRVSVVVRYVDSPARFFFRVAPNIVKVWKERLMTDVFDFDDRSIFRQGEDLLNRIVETRNREFLEWLSKKKSYQLREIDWCGCGLKSMTESTLATAAEIYPDSLHVLIDFAVATRMTSVIDNLKRASDIVNHPYLRMYERLLSSKPFMVSNETLMRNAFRFPHNTPFPVEFLDWLDPVLNRKTKLYRDFCKLMPSYTSSRIFSSLRMAKYVRTIRSSSPSLVRRCVVKRVLQINSSFFAESSTQPDENVENMLLGYCERDTDISSCFKGPSPVENLTIHTCQNEPDRFHVVTVIRQLRDVLFGDHPRLLQLWEMKNTGEKGRVARRNNEYVASQLTRFYAVDTAMQGAVECLLNEFNNFCPRVNPVTVDAMNEPVNYVEILNLLDVPQMCPLLSLLGQHMRIVSFALYLVNDLHVLESMQNDLTRDATTSVSSIVDKYYNSKCLKYCTDAFFVK